MPEYDKGPETVETDAIDDQCIMVSILWIMIRTDYRGNGYDDNRQDQECKHEAKQMKPNPTKFRDLIPEDPINDPFNQHKTGPEYSIEIKKAKIQFRV